MKSVLKTFWSVIAAGLIIAAGATALLWKKSDSESGSGSGLPVPAAREEPKASAGREPAVAAPSYRGAPIGTLEADPAVVKQIGAEQFDKFKKELSRLASALAQNPGQPESWMRVAYIKHFFNDDAGARDVYEYLNAAYGQYPLPYYNLALIYGYNLKEPRKAEQKFKDAIARNPNEESYYIGLADFYREVRHDFAAAIRVLSDGAARLPKGVNLLTSIGAIYRQTGDIPKAIEYYEKARVSGLLAPGELAAVEVELARLKNVQ